MRPSNLLICCDVVAGAMTVAPEALAAEKRSDILLPQPIEFKMVRAKSPK